MKLRLHPHLNPLPEGEEDAKRLARVMQRLILTLLPILISQFVGCETANYAPLVTKSTLRTRHEVDLAQLNRGRTLFVHRCIECHTLPPLWHYTPKDWTEIVNSMSHRASLKPAERDAIIAYILAVRATER